MDDLKMDDLDNVRRAPTKSEALKAVMIVFEKYNYIKEVNKSLAEENLDLKNKLKEKIGFE